MKLAQNINIIFILIDTMGATSCLILRPCVAGFFFEQLIVFCTSLVPSDSAGRKGHKMKQILKLNKYRKFSSE